MLLGTSPRMRIVLVLVLVLVLVFVLEVSCGERVDGIMVLIWWRMWVRVSWIELFIVIDRGGGLDVYWASIRDVWIWM